MNIHLEHGRPPARHRRYGKNLAVAVAVSVTMMVVEIWAALRTGSLALLSDAAHMLADFSGLVIAYLALRLAARPASPQASYGYHRAEVLSAAVNGMLLVGIVVFLLQRAWHRYQMPLAELDTTTVLAVASLGLLANLVAAILIHRDAGENLASRGAWWNVVGDGIASLGVIGATLIVRWTGDSRFDTYVSVLVALIILWGAVALLRSATAILLERVPPHIDAADVKRQVETMADVKNVHDLHIWTHTPGRHSATLHVSIRKDATPRFHEVTRAIEGLLADRFGLDHCTIQVEPEGEDAVSDHYDPVRHRLH